METAVTPLEPLSGAQPTGENVTELPVDPTTGAPVVTGETPPAEEAQGEPEETEDTEDGDELPNTDGGELPNTDGEDASRQLAITAARKMLGVASVVGGGSAEGPTVGPGQDPEKDEVGFDSPGFVRYCLAQSGIEAPESSKEQSEMGPRIRVSEAIPGDLVAFNDGDDIAILIDEGVVIEAPDAGGEVQKEEVDDLDDAWGVSLDSLYGS